MKKMKIGQTFKIDTDRVSQYKGERIVDDVRILVVPKKTDRKVLVYSPKLMADILVCKSDLKETYSKGKEWVLTDSDTNQYGRQISDLLFEFKEDGKEQTIINLLDYTKEEVESIINSYGYTLGEVTINGLSSIHGLYGIDTNWIIAECLFEMDM